MPMPRHSGKDDTGDAASPNKTYRVNAGISQEDRALLDEAVKRLRVSRETLMTEALRKLLQYLKDRTAGGIDFESLSFVDLSATDTVEITDRELLAMIRLQILVLGISNPEEYLKELVQLDIRTQILEKRRAFLNGEGFEGPRVKVAEPPGG